MITMMKSKLSVCGTHCIKCEHFLSSKCSGCTELKGKIWWIDQISAEVCPIYDCVINKKKYENCGMCSELPCAIWKDLKDPSNSDDEHIESINSRVSNLRNQK